MIRSSLAAASLFTLAAAISGVIGMAAGRQDSSPASSQTQGSAPVAPSASKPKPKKVWTNDNVSDAEGTISVVGSANSGGSGARGSKSWPKPATKSSVDPKVIASLARAGNIRLIPKRAI